MSRFPVEKMIGLVSRFDGNYEASNERSREKILHLFGLEGLFSPRHLITGEQMPELRRIAKAHGYKIVTTNRAVQS